MRLGTYRAAAETLRVAQPALTRAVKQLENELGALLLTRGRAGVALTREGRVVLRRAQTILGAFERLGEGLGAPRQVLHVSHVLPEYFAAGPLHARLRDFRAQHPELELVLRGRLPERMLADIARGKLDLGFAWLPIEAAPEGVLIEPVMRDEPMVALPPAHPLARKARLTPRELSGQTVVLFPRRAMPERFDDIVGMLQRGGARVEIRELRANLREVLVAVAAGSGVSIVPRVAAEAHADVGAVVRPLGVSSPWMLAMVRATKRDRGLDALWRSLLTP